MHITFSMTFVFIALRLECSLCGLCYGYLKIMYNWGSVLGYEAVLLGNWFLTFCKHHIPLKRWEPSTW
jgi:hypothetical protein